MNKGMFFCSSFYILELCYLKTARLLCSPLLLTLPSIGMFPTRGVILVGLL